MIMNIELTNKAFQALIFVGVIKTKKMNSVFGSSLESPKNKDAVCPCLMD